MKWMNQLFMKYMIISDIHGGINELNKALIRTHGITKSNIDSDDNEEIAKSIGSEVKRGTTGLFGKGMYTNKEKLVLMSKMETE